MKYTTQQILTVLLGAVQEEQFKADDPQTISAFRGFINAEVFPQLADLRYSEKLQKKEKIAREIFDDLAAHQLVTLDETQQTVQIHVAKLPQDVLSAWQTDPARGATTFDSWLQNASRETLPDKPAAASQTDGSPADDPSQADSPLNPGDPPTTNSGSTEAANTLSGSNPRQQHGGRRPGSKMAAPQTTRQQLSRSESDNPDSTPPSAEQTDQTNRDDSSSDDTAHTAGAAADVKADNPTNAHTRERNRRLASQPPPPMQPPSPRSRRQPTKSQQLVPAANEKSQTSEPSDTSDNTSRRHRSRTTKTPPPLPPSGRQERKLPERRSSSRRPSLVPPAERRSRQSSSKKIGGIQPPDTTRRPRGRGRGPLMPDETPLSEPPTGIDKAPQVTEPPLIQTDTQLIVSPPDGRSLRLNRANISDDLLFELLHTCDVDVTFYGSATMNQEGN